MHAPGMNAYRRQQLESMSPEQLVLVVYEQGVRACRRRDHQRARQAVELLIDGLDFEQGDVAGGLLVLYDWAMRLLRESRFEEAGDLLYELRGTWIEAMGKADGGGQPVPSEGQLRPDLSA